MFIKFENRIINSSDIGWVDTRSIFINEREDFIAGYLIKIKVKNKDFKDDLLIESFSHSREQEFESRWNEIEVALIRSRG